MGMDDFIMQLQMQGELFCPEKSTFFGHFKSVLVIVDSYQMIEEVYLCAFCGEDRHLMKVFKEILKNVLCKSL